MANVLNTTLCPSAIRQSSPCGGRACSRYQERAPTPSRGTTLDTHAVDIHAVDTHFVGRVAALVTHLRTSLTTRLLSPSGTHPSLDSTAVALCFRLPARDRFFTRIFAAAMDPLCGAVDVVMTYSACLVSRPHRDIASASLKLGRLGPGFQGTATTLPWSLEAFPVPSSVGTSM